MQLRPDDKDYNVKVSMFPIVAKIKGEPEEEKELKNSIISEKYIDNNFNDYEEDFIEEDTDLYDEDCDEFEIVESEKKPNFFQKIIAKIKNLKIFKDTPELPEIYEESLENYEEDFEEPDFENINNEDLDENGMIFKTKEQSQEILTEEEKEDLYVPTDYGLGDILTEEELSELIVEAMAEEQNDSF